LELCPEVIFDIGSASQWFHFRKNILLSQVAVWPNAAH
jgi:hypothetical protein